MAHGSSGYDSHALLTLQQAWSMIAENVGPVGVEIVPLVRAEGRVLAGPVELDEDCPPFHKAMMDGYALRSEDCAAPATLRVLGLAAAGEALDCTVCPGAAVRINTGAPVPTGADAVVRVEDTQSSGDGATVRIHAAVKPGQNISARGSNRRKGDIVLSPPARLGPAQLAAAATAGARELQVASEVGVAILATGDELVPAGEPRRPGQIHESNGLMLAALMRRFGASPHDQGIVRDTMEELRSRLVRALQQPVVLTAGGMSMGTLDLVPRACESLGVRWVFHGVDMRPGKPVAYGRGPAGQHIIGLPGNPVSAFVCAHLFARMVVRGLQGFPVDPPPRIRVTLATDVKPARDPRPAFVPARAWSDTDRGLLVEPVFWGGSDDPFGLAKANALLFRANPTQAAAPGDGAEIIILDIEW